MAITSANKLIGQLTQPEYALLKSLTDQQEVSAASLEKLVRAAVRDRLKLARGFVKAARALAQNRDPIVRRSAVSRAYYGAYHAARATVFAIHRRDEDDHEKLPRIVDEVVGGEVSAGSVLKDLRRLRNEMDYSPYPGPNQQAQYEPDEIEDLIKNSVRRAADLLDAFSEHLRERK